MDMHVVETLACSAARRVSVQVRRDMRFFGGSSLSSAWSVEMDETLAKCRDGAYPDYVRRRKVRMHTKSIALRWGRRNFFGVSDLDDECDWGEQSQAHASADYPRRKAPSSSPQMLAYLEPVALVARNLEFCLRLSCRWRHSETRKGGRGATAAIRVTESARHVPKRRRRKFLRVRTGHARHKRRRRRRRRQDPLALSVCSRERGWWRFGDWRFGTLAVRRPCLSLLHDPVWFWLG